MYTPIGNKLIAKLCKFKTIYVYKMYFTSYTVLRKMDLQVPSGAIG